MNGEQWPRGGCSALLVQRTVLNKASRHLANTFTSAQGRWRSVQSGGVLRRRRRLRGRRRRRLGCRGSGCSWRRIFGGRQFERRRRRRRSRAGVFDAAAWSCGCRRRRWVDARGCRQLDRGGGQLRHLLWPSVVEDLDGAEVDAGSFRQMATPINFHNIVIMGP